jgi:tetratricopeptide (TPR) repeat protein
MRDETGRLQRQPEQLAELHRLLKQASAVTGDDAFRCHVLLASVYTALREFEPAVAHLEKGHQIDPENTDVQFNLAMAHQELGHFDAALRYGRGVLQQDANHAAALNFVGYILAERGLELQDSETLIRRALKQEPDNGYYVDSLGWVLYQSGNYGDATAELERAVQLTGERDAVILEHLGDAYVKVERLNDAMRAYGQSRQLEPNNPALLEKIKQVEANLGE